MAHRLRRSPDSVLRVGRRVGAEPPGPVEWRVDRGRFPAGPGGHGGCGWRVDGSGLVGATEEEREAITVRTQFGGDEVVKAKAGTGSATLSMAYAGYLFTEEVLKGLRGEPDIVQCAFVESTLTSAPYFASPCKFGPDGVEEVLPFGTISEYEQGKLDEMLPTLTSAIEKGIEFAKSS